MQDMLVLCILLWNVIVFLLYGADKYRAIQGKWRISEHFLQFCSILLGGIGSLLGMWIFHHKTKKPIFQIISWISFIIILTILYVSVAPHYLGS